MSIFNSGRPFSLVLGLAPTLALCFVFSACSDAETPNAYFDGGQPVLVTDGGPPTGGANQPCGGANTLTCNDNTLICVRGTPNICRLECDSTATDPCGVNYTCRQLDTSAHACVPGGSLNESCPCDEGFSCTRIDANTNICKTSCTRAAGDAGPEVACPADGGRCLLFAGDAVNGACIN